jgi:hypothetical protein
VYCRCLGSDCGDRYHARALWALHGLVHERMELGRVSSRDRHARAYEALEETQHPASGRGLP